MVVTFGRGVAGTALGTTLVVGLLCLALPATQRRLRGVAAPGNARLPLAFPHERHRDVACQTCHHNLTDGTGRLPCLTCHAALPTGAAWSREPLFHALCLTCHRQQAALGRRHGPTALCSGCHRAR